ncbi:AzlD domain-containing protein [Salinicoccus cyprini]|uniref:AzlD domain-containing protein n=1 Tax=Salinicoccus cyprini TaxID=2493691 RepID=A0A558ASN5_9STAP|nr:AzlD domain-containing protein [Salinicoccus cyprini]
MDRRQRHRPLCTIHRIADSGCQSPLQIWHCCGIRHGAALYHEHHSRVSIRHCHHCRHTACRSAWPDSRTIGGIQLILLIAALCAVTIIPRIIPAFIVDRLVLPAWCVTYLNYIPYAALGVLIFPGILTAVEHPVHGVLGGGFAVILALLRVPLFFIVLGSIIFIYIIML